MERVTISLDDALLADFDKYIARKGYQNRSETVRDIIRERLESEPAQGIDADFSVGCVSYVYNHHQRDLAKRLTEAQHRHHDVVVSALHVHLDHENCFEVTLLRGPSRDVRDFADTLVAETGVRHGWANLVSVEAEDSKHKHGYRHSHSHLHLTPKS